MPGRRARLRFLLTICVALALLGLIHARGRATTGRFSDTPLGYPYAPAIMDLADRAIVNGYADGTFRPEAPLMRQQFVKMLTLVLGLPVSEADECPFVDVFVGGPSTLYPDNYVAVGASEGIVRGTTPTLFSPYDSLTRAQMISMIVRAIDSLADGPLPAPKGEDGSTWGQFDPQHDVNARWAESEGLLEGLPLDNLDPRGFATRGEVAQVLHNFAQDVRYYGAKGDGVTDDYQAITNAMQTAAAAGQPLYFPAGTYLVRNQLSPPDGVTLMGAGPTSVLYMPESPSHSLAFIFNKPNPNNVTIRDFTLRGDGPAMHQGGLHLYGARDSTLKNLRFENLWYGMKLGGADRQAQRWTVEDITATNNRMPMYIQNVEDSTFARMSLEGVRVDQGLDHSLYMSASSYRLTFTDVTLLGGGGYGLHLYSGYAGTTSSDITFNNLTIDAARQPMAIADGFSNIYFNNLTTRMSINEVQLRVSGCNNVVFDGITASGGYAFIGTWNGGHAGTITIKNVAYDGPFILSPKAGEQGIADLVVENAAPENTGSTKAP